MNRKWVGASVIALLLVPISGTAAWSRHYRSAPHQYSHSRHHHGGNDSALLWGLGGLVLGATMIAALQEPPPRVVEVEPAPVTYGYEPAYGYGPGYAQPAVADCRWERYVLDSWGNYLYDRSGRPVKEYAVGRCDAPPPW